MKRKLISVALVLLLTAVLSGCCLKHDMQPATCTEPATCSKCGHTEGEALGHAEVIDKAAAPTCTETGLTEGSHCSVCGEVLEEQKTVDALGHIEVIDKAAAPTCTETGLTEGSHCSVCGEVLEEQKTVDALGHIEVIDEAAAPTCTEPGLTEGSHCSVCGEVLKEQKTVDAPGHVEVIDEAVAPTCTEPGLTEGRHCSVCGEVLEEQEVVEAPGHDWEEATFMKPRTCRRCGETEGTALGARYFLDLLVHEDDTEDPDDRNTPEEAAEEGPGKYDYVLTGSTFGFGLGSWVDNSSVTVAVDTEDESLNKYGLSAVVNGSEPLNMVFASDDEGIYISFPDIMNKCYFISRENLLEILGPYLENSGVNTESAADLVFDVISPEDLKALGEKYLEILLSVANVHNTTERLTVYELRGLEEEQLALKITCVPETSDWRIMLRSLFSTAANDEQLMDVLVRLVEISAQNMSRQELFMQFGIWSIDQIRPALRQMLDQYMESVNELAESLTGTAFEAAVGTGRIFAVTITLPDGTGYGYESFGDPDDLRMDAVVAYEDQVSVLALNTLQSWNGGVKGKLYIGSPEIMNLSYYMESPFDGSADYDIRFSASGVVMTLKSQGSQESRLFTFLYDSEENGFEVNIQKSVREENLVLDVDDRIVLESEENMAIAVFTTVYSLENTDFFQKASEILENPGFDEPETAPQEPQHSLGLFLKGSC